MLRFTHIVSGTILYDGIDITKIPRRRLREALTIIPQEPVLFNGTVESNLDPSGKVPVKLLGEALDECKGIASFQHHHDEEAAQNGAPANGSTPASNGDVSAGNGHANGHSLESGRDAAAATENGHAGPGEEGHHTLAQSAEGISLSTMVNARGENFSHGQRQVLSLCRALVRKSPLMLLDEATASMDYETDKGIQEVLRRELNAHGRDRTLVTIAHRLRTIIDYDTIIVMGGGKVLE